MKKALLALVALATLCPALSGCVDENPNVVIVGITLPKTEDIGEDSECEVNNPKNLASEIPICNNARQFTGTILFKNLISGTVPWTSSGGGSGTTYQSEQANPGVIWLDRIYLKCVSVVEECSSGDDSCYKEYEISCSGEEALEIPISMALPGNESGLCWPFSYSAQPILNWISDYTDADDAYVMLDIYAHYHDSGKMSGNTSHTLVGVRKINPANYLAKEYCQYCADENYCCSEQLKSQGYDFDFCPKTAG